MARFQHEAWVLASLNHSRIAAIYGLEESSVLALAMELVEGPTLADRIAGGAVPVAEALAIAWQIAGALEYAHDKGVIHCDLKPANIKTSLEGAVKVLDFGLAKAAGDSAAAPTAGRTGAILGTPAYMAPEQAGGMPVDRRADIWSSAACQPSRRGRRSERRAAGDRPRSSATSRTGRIFRRTCPRAFTGC